MADEPYKGTPLYFSMLTELTKKLENTALKDVKETKDNQQITLLAKETGFPRETIMRMVFSELVAENINRPEITAEVVFGYIKQNFPPRLPGNLLAATLLWEQIDIIVEDAASGLVFSDDETLSSQLDSAVDGNLISLAVKLQKQKIIDAFHAVRNTFTLEKPILVGNGSLLSVLEESSLNASKYGKVSEIFIIHKGTGSDFWEDLKTQGIPQKTIN